MSTEDTVMVVAAYVPAEYVQRRRIQDYLRAKALQLEGARANAAKEKADAQREGVPGLPSGTMLDVFGQLLAALSPLLIALVQSALGKK